MILHSLPTEILIDELFASTFQFIITPTAKLDVKLHSVCVQDQKWQLAL